MAQRMRRQRHGHPSGAGVALNQGPKHHPRHARAARGHKHVIAVLTAQNGRTGLAKVALQPLLGVFAVGYQSLFVAFTGDAQHLLLPTHVPQLKLHQFAHAQATGVHQLKHGAVSQPQRLGQIGGLQQGLHLRLA